MFNRVAYFQHCRRSQTAATARIRFQEDLLCKAGRFYSTTLNVYIFPIDAEFDDVTAPGGRKPYSPAPSLSGRTTLNVLFASFLPSNSTRSREAPPEA